jgi:hypothetical protein
MRHVWDQLILMHQSPIQVDKFPLPQIVVVETSTEHVFLPYLVCLVVRFSIIRWRVHVAGMI